MGMLAFLSTTARYRPTQFELLGATHYCFVDRLRGDKLVCGKVLSPLDKIVPARLRMEYHEEGPPRRFSIANALGHSSLNK